MIEQIARPHGLAHELFALARHGQVGYPVPAHHRLQQQRAAQHQGSRARIASKPCDRVDGQRFRLA
jgi:hypothetical protein